MHWHRPLGEMLTDISTTVDVARSFESALRASSVEMTLPVEVSLEEEGGELTFIADLPVWRWRTVFDQNPSRLRIRWEEMTK